MCGKIISVSLPRSGNLAYQLRSFLRFHRYANSDHDHFTAAGKVDLFVSLAAHDVATGEHRVEFQVRDTDSGLPAERIDRLCKLFVQDDGGARLTLRIPWRGESV